MKIKLEQKTDYLICFLLSFFQFKNGTEPYTILFP